MIAVESVEGVEAEWGELIGTRSLAAVRSSLEAVVDAAVAEGRAVSLRPTW
jgi:hypothetical protein